MALNFAAWHDRTSANHKEMLDKFAAQGFRTVSLCVYGDRNDPRYAAVMIKRPTIIATKQFFNLSLTEWQAKFNEMAAQGFGPYIVSATGPSNNPVIAAAFKQMNSIPLTRHGLTIQEFADLNDKAWREGLILAWADAYGTPEDERYIAVWRQNTEQVAWNMAAITEPADAATLQQHFNAITAQGGRPTHIAITPTGKYIELFVDNAIGPWVSHGEMTSAGYQQQFDKLTAQGLAPVCVMAQGAGANTKFAAIFAASEDPITRVFRATGSPAISGIDSAMEKFVKANSLRGCSLAITQGTRLVYARGYTYAEPDYPNLQPTTLYRQASVSKTFCAIATYQLIQENKLKLDTTMQSVLNLKTPDGKTPVDSRFSKITIRHLLESTSQLQRGGMFQNVAAANAFKAKLPATPAQVSSYIASLELEGEPGDPNKANYNNTGYFMLSQVIAKLRGASSFESALEASLFKPLGMKRTRQSRTFLADQAADEARYHLSNLRRKDDQDALGSLAFGFSTRSSDPLISPWQYGVDDYEMFDGSGGLSSAVTDLARIMAAFSLREKNPMLSVNSLDALFTNAANATSALKGDDRHGFHGLDWAVVSDATNHVYGAAKGGWMPSNQSYIEFTTGGLGYALSINGNGQDSTGDWLAEVRLIAQSHDWGTTNLFPQFGMSILDSAPIKFSIPPIKPQLAMVQLMALHKKSMTAARNRK
ncbi:MAG TPA: serine hydrolase [Blastocatellia bacterium]|nr:serine hydrolase [Blastocatellia bacterium]